MTGILRRTVLASSAALAVAGPAAAQDKIKVKFGILTTASQAAFYVGTKKGIFAKYGFDVEVQPLATGVQANQALAAGQADWSGGGVESTVVAWATNLPFKAYSMYAKGGDSYGILVRKESGIASPKDLKGKKIAVPQGTAPAQGLNQILNVDVAGGATATGGHGSAALIGNAGTIDPPPKAIRIRAADRRRRRCPRRRASLGRRTSFPSPRICVSAFGQGGSEWRNKLMRRTTATSSTNRARCTCPTTSRRRSAP